MLFNSLEFLIFLPTVFLLYWFVFQKNHRAQNLLLLISSYIFYGWWDWRFLILIFLSSIVDYSIGLKIFENQSRKKRKFYLWTSILFNIGLLGFFKYFNFFISSWTDLLGSLGYEQKSVWTLNVILPIGISFYTFQTMSYSLDIYFKKFKPTKDFISFASFVSFFPQLVAGPIERSSNLLPQILTSRFFKYEQGVIGLRLILFGMFKKVVIADSLAWRVDYCFENFHTLDGGTLLLGLIYFSVQIYCDFSGYSDIAIGSAKLFGIDLMSNFNFPYFSKNIGEFWKRWHISLSSWFRDYLYIPLGGSRKNQWTSIRNILIIFILSGFWHGANWTFIIWGFTHALFYIPLFLTRNRRQYKLRISNVNFIYLSIKTLLRVGMTYLSTTIAWVFFRSEDISSSFEYLIYMITSFSIPLHNRGGITYVFLLVFFDLFLMKSKNKILQDNIFSRWTFYIVILLVIFLHIDLEASEFIYFQF